jgi:hypothetical protein
MPYTSEERRAARRLRRNTGHLSMPMALFFVRNVRLRDRAARRRALRAAERRSA